MQVLFFKLGALDLLSYLVPAVIAAFRACVCQFSLSLLVLHLFL